MNIFKRKPKMGLLPAATSPLMYRILGAGIMPAKWTAPTSPEIGSQAVQNCLVWAFDYHHEMATGKTFSRGYLYGERAAGDWQGQGMDLAQMLANAKKYGNVLLTNWNREDEVQTAQHKVAENAETLRAFAAKNPIKAYYLCRDAAAVKSARMAGLGVIIGVAVDKMEADADGVFHCVNGRLGFHAMALIDWDETGGYPAPWRVANSWGDKWGIDGFCYMTDEDVFRTGMVYAVEFAQPLADCPNCPSDTIITPVVPAPIIKRRTLKYQTPRMRDGDGYTDVTEFQTLCNEVGISVPIDGIYTHVTRDACIRLQQRVFEGLDDEIDGIVAGNTWAALDALVAKAAKGDLEVEDEEEGSGERPARQLINWAMEQLGQMYLIGAQGEKVFDGMIYRGKTYTAQEYIRYRERKSDKDYYRALAFYNILVAQGKTPIKAYDCSGLLVCWLLERGFIEQDVTAHGLYRLCKAHKAISTNYRDCSPGWFCFQRKWTGSVNHVGLYVGDVWWKGVHYPNGVLECKGRDDGVVIRDMREDGRLQWNCFGVLPDLDDDVM